MINLSKNTENNSKSQEGEAQLEEIFRQAAQAALEIRNLLRIPYMVIAKRAGTSQTTAISVLHWRRDHNFFSLPVAERVFEATHKEMTSILDGLRRLTGGAVGD